MPLGHQILVPRTKFLRIRSCTFRSYPPLDPDIIRPVIPEHPPTPWSGPARRSVWSYSFGFSNREGSEDEEIADAEDKGVGSENGKNRVRLQIKALLGRTDTCIADDLSHTVTSPSACLVFVA